MVWGTRGQVGEVERFWGPFVMEIELRALLMLGKNPASETSCFVYLHYCELWTPEPDAQLWCHHLLAWLVFTNHLSALEGFLGMYFLPRC